MKKCGFCQYKYKRLKTAKTCGKDENRMNIFSGIFRSRDKPTDRTAGSSYSFFLGNSSAGKYVTERSAMQMTAVYCCVRILSEAVASLPLQFIHLYRGRNLCAVVRGKQTSVRKGKDRGYGRCPERSGISRSPIPSLFLTPIDVTALLKMIFVIV